MGTIFLGSEAIDRDEVTWGQLRWKYRAIYPDVYTPRMAEPSLYTNTVGAWLWSGRKAPVTGRAASALHGSLWVDGKAAIELLWPNNRPPSGIITRNDHFASDEVMELHGMRRPRRSARPTTSGDTVRGMWRSLISTRCHGQRVLRPKMWRR
jgi:hypothetical protein